MTDETRTLDALDLGGPAGQEAFLVVYLGERPRVIPLPDGAEVTIGRSRACTVYVDDERISRRHTRVVRRGADVFVADLGSRNGTRIGGVRIEGERRAQGGDLISVGPVVAMVAVATEAGGAAGGKAPLVVPSGADGGVSEPHVIADPAMARVYDLCRRVASTTLSVLITGETGVGKERVAEAIHRASPRAAQPFVRLHLAALPDTLVESELFGHEKGAFTGADRRRVGYFESASGGTLFLDEIGELPAGVQAKLLRVIETRRVVRLGSTDEIEVDARVVAATNRDLRAEVKAGRFREDLFFRLSAFRIDVPPLRERRSEIPLLATLFVREMARSHDRPVPAIEPDAMAALAAYAWPGNVRELKHVVEAAFVMASPGDIRAEHLPASLSERPAASLAAPSPPALAGDKLPGAMDRLEREAILAALTDCGGNQTAAAKKLGISRRTLLYKMAKHELRSVRKIE